MLKELNEKGYVVGATVRQYHHSSLYDDAVVFAVHANGALDVHINGKKYGWSVKFCKPAKEAII